MYLRLFNKGLGVRKKLVGPKTATDFVKRACLVLGVDPTVYTFHFFRCCATTNLADADVSVLNLKKHVQWKLDSVAEAYIGMNVTMQ